MKTKKIKGVNVHYVSSNEEQEKLLKKLSGGSKMKEAKIVGAWAAVGVGVGVAVGTATGALALWTAVGVAVGALIGFALSRKRSGDPS